jgi:hypothetical protein
VRLVIAIGIGLAVFLAGVALLRMMASMRPKEETPAEDVDALDVYFVCVECGTELRVERLGELQVPRHCGEQMRVERRAAAT